VETHLPDEITWNWSGTIYGGNLKFDAWAESPVIQSIVVSSPKPVRFTDVVTALGNPSYVTVHAEEGTDIGSGMWYSIQLYYISSGVYLNLNNEIKDKISTKPTMSSETVVNYAVFFAPSLDGLSVALGQDKAILQNWMLPWQGTFDFDTYCKLQYPSNEVPYRCK